jgi:dipeptidyl aminopeptidase/acylaminoacyl peptidase
LSGFEDARGRAIARCESFEVEASDGASVHGFMFVPSHPRTRTPALLWLHGGPIGCTADGWSWRWNPLLASARGYAVIMPNPRGSTGYGQAFVEGAWNNAWGDACYRDVLAVVKAARTTPPLDGRIAALGASFGGYMASLLACTTEELSCVVSHAGPFHLSALYGESDIPGWRRWEMGVDPNDDPQAYDRHSPHLRASNWRAPALLSHGALDGRVPYAQSLRAFEALQRRGVESSLILYPDEGHRIEGPINLVHWYDSVFAFLARHLPAEPAS